MFLPHRGHLPFCQCFKGLGGKNCSNHFAEVGAMSSASRWKGTANGPRGIFCSIRLQHGLCTSQGSHIVLGSYTIIFTLMAL